VAQKIYSRPGQQALEPRFPFGYQSQTHPHQQVKPPLAPPKVTLKRRRTVAVLLWSQLVHIDVGEPGPESL